MFTGEYRHTIDAKGRIAVPARFRSELSGTCYVCNWLEGCIAIYPRVGWDRLTGQVDSLNKVSDATAREFSRFLFSGSFEVELDGQGRVLLPPSLREEFGLTTDAVVIGLGDRLEVWEPERWASYKARKSDPDAFAARLSGLAI